MNVIKLMEEHVAIAYFYQKFQKSEFEKSSKTILFFDLGNTKFSAYAIEFEQ